jgi:hypothetical protein
VLIGVEDVEARLGEEAADRGDQPRPVRAGKQQAGCGLRGDARIMPPQGGSGVKVALRW